MRSFLSTLKREIESFNEVYPIFTIIVFTVLVFGIRFFQIFVAFAVTSQFEVGLILKSFIFLGVLEIVSLPFSLFDKNFKNKLKKS